MDIRDFDLNSLSNLEYRIKICRFGGERYTSALILEFSGTYRWGSQGNTDADFIEAIKAAALAVNHVDAIVYDFRNMSYEWGNSIWEVLPYTKHGLKPRKPVAMVISDKCRKGFSSCETAVPPMFESLEEALRFVASDPTRQAT